MRLLSHSEATAVHTCQAQWDFRYGGELAGSCLRPLAIRQLLREGRAWGAAVAAYHSAPLGLDATAVKARITLALSGALEEDADELREAGTYSEAEHEAIQHKLEQMLAHYVATTEPLLIDRVEHELVVPIPSRTGRRRSNLYRLQCYLDGVHDADGLLWLVEYKLRGQLSDFEQIVLSRQTRWYAWAWREATGREPDGVIVDERLNALPGEVNFNKDGRPSARQTCTPEAYEQAGGRDDGVLEALRERRWQARHPLLLETGELDEAGQQLTSTAHLVHLLKTGVLYPVRNPSKPHCSGCDFKTICQQPTDSDVVETHYRRVLPKREREEVTA